MAKSIVYEKAIDGTYYIVDIVPDRKAKKLEIIIAYISGNKKGTAASAAMPLKAGQVPDIRSPRHTSETILPSASETSVSDHLRNINAEKSSPSVGAWESDPARLYKRKRGYRHAPLDTAPIAAGGC